MAQMSLRAARVNAGLRLDDTAKALGVSSKTISNWENGNAEPRISQCVKLGRLYGLPLDDIIFCPTISES